jgi:hypothetical protein
VAELEFTGPVAFNEADLLDAGAVDGSAHGLIFVFEVHGALDFERADRAYHYVTRRHDAYRTSFVRGPAGWVRRVHRDCVAVIDHHDLREAPDPEAAARADVIARFNAGFDRERPLLLRAYSYRLGPERCWLVFHADHVMMDGLSFAVGLGEFLLTYLALEGGALPELDPPMQPRAWEAGVRAAIEASGSEPLPPYPADGFRLLADPGLDGGPDPAGARATFDLGDPAPVDALARAAGVSRSAPVVAAMAIALSAVARRSDVGFTLIRSGRRDAAASGVIGCLAWGDAWSVAFDPAEPLRALLLRADAFIRDLAPARMRTIPETNPPTRRLVLNLNRFGTALPLPGLQVFPRLDVQMDVRMWASHDLLVQVFPMPHMTPMVVRYRTSLLSPSTVDRFGAAMTEALRRMVADLDAPIGGA